jgi:hypothetical protein
MKDGTWLVPESERPPDREKPRISAGGMPSGLASRTASDVRTGRRRAAAETVEPVRDGHEGCSYVLLRAPDKDKLKKLPGHSSGFEPTSQTLRPSVATRKLSHWVASCKSAMNPHDGPTSSLFVLTYSFYN